MAEIKLCFRFVVVFYVITTAHFCYAESSRFPSSRVEVEKHLNKSAVKSIKSPDGDIIDCVHISHQPAFDHPLLKNHTIKMKPDYHPNRINVDGIKDGTLSPYVTQVWHSYGKCPKGTIPVRRTKKEDVLRAGYVNSYGKKKSFVDVELDVRERHEHAIAYTNGQVYGAKATLNVWNPKVEEHNEFSVAEILITGGSIDSDLISAGWQVYPGMYGDTNTRFFIYWTNDGHQTTGCYNLRCSGFIQINKKIAIGGSLSPISQMYGSQYEFTILIWKVYLQICNFLSQIISS
ncbi:putative neprosin [Helianthus debilis subsp. tardiflorus]